MWLHEDQIRLSLTTNEALRISSKPIALLSLVLIEIKGVLGVNALLPYNFQAQGVKYEATLGPDAWKPKP